MALGQIKKNKAHLRLSCPLYTILISVDDFTDIVEEKVQQSNGKSIASVFLASTEKAYGVIKYTPKAFFDMLKDIAPNEESLCDLIVRVIKLFKVYAECKPLFAIRWKVVCQCDGEGAAEEEKFFVTIRPHNPMNTVVDVQCTRNLIPESLVPTIDFSQIECETCKTTPDHEIVVPKYVIAHVER